MTNFLGGKRPVLMALALVLAGPAIPALAQTSSSELRLRQIEAELRALQRQVSPQQAGQQSATTATATNGTTTSPVATPMTDLLARFDTVEAQLARLTSQSEENSNRLRQLETRLGVAAPAPATVAAGTAASAGTPASAPAPAPTPAATPTETAFASNLSAMTGGVSAPKPVVTPKPVATTRSAASTGPSAQRVAAVRAIAKPQTEDPGDDEYSYGYRLWEAKFFPEAAQQLKLFVDKYPHHARLSFARNLLGRAYLDDGKPRDAAPWFLQNYQSEKHGARAPDSLLFLAESMRQLNDKNRACIALSEFADTYPAETAGRLKAQYDATRVAVKCN